MAFTGATMLSLVSGKLWTSSDAMNKCVQSVPATMTCSTGCTDALFTTATQPMPCSCSSRSRIGPSDSVIRNRFWPETDATKTSLTGTNKKQVHTNLSVALNYHYHYHYYYTTATTTTSLLLIKNLCSTIGHVKHESECCDSAELS